MKIDVFKNPDKVSTIALEDTCHKLEIDNIDYVFDETVAVVCHLKRDSSYTSIEGNVTVKAEFECSRCLKQYKQDVCGTFTIVARQLKLGESVPDTVEEDDGDVEGLVYLTHDEFTLDITEYVHDAVLLALPLKPVCREDCRGLCPVCGANLNERECGCNKNMYDPRWNVLSGLFNS